MDQQPDTKLVKPWKVTVFKIQIFWVALSFHYPVVGGWSFLPLLKIVANFGPDLLLPGPSAVR